MNSLGWTSSAKYTSLTGRHDCNTIMSTYIRQQHAPTATTLSCTQPATIRHQNVNYPWKSHAKKDVGAMALDMALASDYITILLPYWRPGKKLKVMYS